MATTGLQVLGVLLAVTGWVGQALVTAAPFWRVSAFVGGELVVAEAQWEGLWMSCLVRPGSGHTQCKSFDSGLALPAGTQARRVLALLALLLGVLALGLSVLGMKCTRCLGDGGDVDIGVRETKARLARVGGALFAAAAVVFLVPVCWTAYAVVRDFYDPAVAPPLKRELGPALYLGWGVALLTLVGGALINAGSAPPTGGGVGGGGRGGTSGGVAAAAYGGGKGNPQPTPPEGKKEKAYV
ncbi:hypothetical protein AALO_G00095430 [Alosa alosa]|uniref:Claudin n=1 Tax=Alosa alosa TaxID=278164 RepID=A0AAV6GXL5_9TELE|nr:claudin-9-like [Alosa alosa]KAG5278122.1 hypothetical protein AALO_G00095430 [Alosa alosa]